MDEAVYQVFEDGFYLKTRGGATDLEGLFNSIVLRQLKKKEVRKYLSTNKPSIKLP